MEEEPYIKLLRTIGIEFNDAYITPKQKWTGYFVIITLIVAVTLAINFCKRNLHDFEVLIPGISITVVIIGSFFKSYTFFIKKNAIYILTKNIKNLKQLGSYGEERITSLNTLLNNIFKIGYALSFSTTLIYLITPTCHYFYQFYLAGNQNVTRYIPFNLQFPIVDQSESPYNELCTILASVLGYITVLMSLVVKAVFIYSSLNIKTHFEILQYKIRTNNWSHTSYELKDLVNYHVKVLDLADSLNSIFKEMFFVQTVLITCQICLLIFQLLEVSKHVLERIPDFGFLSVQTTEYFLFCYGGELITFESFNVSVAIQESSWYYLKPSYRKVLLLMMVRAQKPLYFSGIVLVASMKTFLAIVNKACSYFTVMKSYK